MTCAPAEHLRRMAQIARKSTKKKFAAFCGKFFCLNGEKLHKKIGADEVVYPEKQLGDWTAIRYTSDHVTDYIEIDSDHSIFEVTVPDAWKGKTLGELDVRKKYGINVLGVKENGKIDFAISAGCKLDGDKTLMVLGKFKDLKKCFKI